MSSVPTSLPIASSDSTDTPAKVPPSEDREAQIMWRVRWRVGRSHLRQLLTEARLRTALVAGLSFLFWLGLFVLFYEGFKFLSEYIGGAGEADHARTVKFIFHVFFASLNVMLIFSAGIIVYSGLFASTESKFLLTQPLRPERIVLHKFQEAVIFSSWGFLLLASPMAIAYGIVAQAPWYYFALLAPLILAFVYIPCGIGAVLCLLIVHRLPKLKLAVVAAAAIAVIGMTGVSIYKTVSGPRAEMFGKEWFQETQRLFRVTQNEFLPSTWLASSLLEAARPTPVIISSPTDMPIIHSCLYLAVLISNALLMHLLVVAAGKRWYRSSFSGLQCRPRKRRRGGIALIDRFAQTLLVPFPRQVGLLLLKDWQLLRRDPVQWSQFLIFFGLLGLYFLNVGRFNNPGNDVNFVTWVNMVSFLNLAVVGLILSTFTTRFIYPMISLEGRRFWVLGLMPMDRQTIVISKFLFAVLGSLAPCTVLVLLSDLILRVDPLVVIVHQLTTLLLCIGLAAMAVGLGSTMPNFREPSPSKIAAGFGGTLNLVLSAFFIILVVSLTALPCHFYLLAETNPLRDSLLNINHLKTWMIAGGISAVIITLVASYLTLRQGIRAFQKLEFL